MGSAGFRGQGRLEVSFPPEMPHVTSAALDDSNEFVSSRGGWLGDWKRLKFFHWVNPAVTLSSADCIQCGPLGSTPPEPWRPRNWLDLKLSDIAALYELALHHETDLASYGMSLGRLLAVEAADGPQRRMMPQPQ